MLGGRIGPYGRYEYRYGSHGINHWGSTALHIKLLCYCPVCRRPRPPPWSAARLGQAGIQDQAFQLNVALTLIPPPCNTLSQSPLVSIELPISAKDEPSQPARDPSRIALLLVGGHLTVKWTNLVSRVTICLKSPLEAQFDVLKTGSRVHRGLPRFSLTSLPPSHLATLNANEAFSTPSVAPSWCRSTPHRGLFASKRHTQTRKRLAYKVAPTTFGLLHRREELRDMG
ncbi:hypothetical protein B0J13DRAFT_546988 [Dactylonectria estremocensis]|uniref:Uncharacterized protein n=1 Tax=Dactylonectria estremocensis TaxID=1079267 RepID=A0A9P9F2R3_9HYPO|nr:hypothetical protein B0J13DRAFT_546988 [Dactylonectria estremocensis]